MKILWVNPNFLHPTTKGGQIRTLEMVRRLHQRHEVHYVAFENPQEPEGPRRAGEYSTRAYPVQHAIPSKQSPAFALQFARGLFQRLPLAVGRYDSGAMRHLLARLIREQRFDSLVCDFLFPAPNFDDLSSCVLFQHNVETIIWRRHAETAKDPLRRWVFQTQAERMFRYEAEVCRAVGYTIAVSEIDAQRMRELFGINNVGAVPTGVDTDYFAPPPQAEFKTDLVFVGSMDWMPNIDGMLWFTQEVLPLIRARRPEAKVAVVGRMPTRAILDLAAQDPLLEVTGTVPDVRPYLWGAKACIVPLRIGGGTRLKIYEAMAAKVPVVSTTIGAEGLAAHDGRDILLADTPAAFADRCLELLDDAELRNRLSAEAWELVSAHYSWERATRDFEKMLEEGPRPH